MAAFSAAMHAAIAAAAEVRTDTAPNPWVGAVVASGDGRSSPPARPSRPAARTPSVEALRAPVTPAAARRWCARSSRAATTVVRRRASTGWSRPGSPGSSSASRTPTRTWRARASTRCVPPASTSTVGVEAEAVARAAGAYLVHRRTGRPYVVLKLAATVDGGSAAPDGTSHGSPDQRRARRAPAARGEPGRARRRRDGAGRRPALTVRHVAGPDPLRVVLGRAPADARVHPCLERSGDLGAVLDELGSRASCSSSSRAEPRRPLVPRRRPRRPLRGVPRAGRHRWRRGVGVLAGGLIDDRRGRRGRFAPCRGSVPTCVDLVGVGRRRLRSVGGDA